MARRTAFMLYAALFSATVAAQAAEVVVPMHRVDEEGVQQRVGTVTIAESPYGLVFTPQIEGLSPGVHGFHVHEKPSCAAAEKDGKPVAALAAGGHYDPAGSGRHGTPWGDGHLGDLPALVVDARAQTSVPVLAPRLKRLSEVKGHALMVHIGGDNHADHPAPLGGGGARMLCGVIE